MEPPATPAKFRNILASTKRNAQRSSLKEDVEIINQIGLFENENWFSRFRCRTNFQSPPHRGFRIFVKYKTSLKIRAGHLLKKSYRKLL